MLIVQLIYFHIYPYLYSFMRCSLEILLIYFKKSKCHSLPFTVGFGAILLLSFATSRKAGESAASLHVLLESFDFPPLGAGDVRSWA